VPQPSSHSLPSYWRWSLLVLVIWWLWDTSIPCKIRCLTMASVFAGIEFVFRAVTSTNLPFRNRKNFFHQLYHQGHTTIEQYLVTFFSIPFINDQYRALLPSAMLRIALFPLNLWAIEIVAGYYLLKVWQRRAWFYEGPHAHCDGLITFAYWHHWLGLGVIHEVMCVYVYYPISEPWG